jgi:urease subunit beta
MIPGEYKLRKDPVVCNAGKTPVHVTVLNRGDRPVQIGSHFHFYEANNFLHFDREKALGRHLNIPAGTAVRFEPGDEKDVALVSFSGKREIHGFQNKVNGPVGKEDK